MKKAILTTVVFALIAAALSFVIYRWNSMSIRVCDEMGEVIPQVQITYQKFSILGSFDGGITNINGELTLGPTLPAIESVRANKQGYVSAQKWVGNKSVIYLILQKSPVGDLK